MARLNKSYLGKGTIYVEEIGGLLGALSIGNCSQLDFAINENKLEQKDFQDAGGATINTVSNVDSVVASITMLKVDPENLALALRGEVTTTAGAATITSEPHTARPDGFLKFVNVADKTEAVTVTGPAGTPTYTEGTDYELKNSGIVVIAEGSIVDGEVIEIDYVTADSTTVEALQGSGKFYRIFFDGLNEAESGKPVVLSVHKGKFNYAQALALISEDFANLPVTLDVLKDESIVGSTLSKFFKIEQQD